MPGSQALVRDINGFVHRIERNHLDGSVDSGHHLLLPYELYALVAENADVAACSLSTINYTGV